MAVDSKTLRTILSRDLMDVLIRVALVGVLLTLSLRIFSPFMDIMLWALILAVTLYPLHEALARRLGGRQGLAASLLVFVALIIIGVPVLALANSLAIHLRDIVAMLQDQSFTISPPPPGVADWPIIGGKIHTLWSQAAHDLPTLLKNLQPQLKELSKSLLLIMASAASGGLKFLGSLIIAGIMMAYGHAGSAAMLRILLRLAGPRRGPQLYELSVATIRSVSMGVIGVAFIQALLLSLGFLWADVPGTGILALVVFVLGIAQLPAALVSLPVIVYLWTGGDADTTHNVMYTVYLVVAGMADNILKPLLLGRGVDAPMPIVLLGALGGMVSAGIIGLFVGAVLLTLTYVIFMGWVEGGAAEAVVGQEDMEAAEQLLSRSTPKE